MPTGNTVSASWEDEVDDEPVLESWDVDSEEEREKERVKKAEVEAAKKKREEEAAKKKLAKKGTKVLMEIDTVDEKTRKEMLKKAELDADLNNAADLFGGLGVAEEHPRAKATRLEAEAAIAKLNATPKLTKDTPIDVHPLFNVETKQDFEKLRKALAPAITKLADVSQLNYSSSLVIDLIRDISGPLTVESLRKLQSTLNVIMKDKERQERQLRLAKASGTATGGAGKKKAKPAAKSSLGSSSFKKDLDFDTTNYDDDFGDDDFM